MVNMVGQMQSKRKHNRAQKVNYILCFARIELCAHNRIGPHWLHMVEHGEKFWFSQWGKMIFIICTVNF